MTGTRAELSPIFIVGSGRSGTTLLYELITRHPDLAWTSALTNRYPRFPALSLVSRVATSWNLRGLRPSVESPNALEICGFARDQVEIKGRAITSEDIPDWSGDCLKSFIEKHLRWMARSSFVMKSTRNTLRIPALASIFPDAFFVHIVRHPCAVTRSLLNVNWWPDLELWWTEGTPRILEAEGVDPHGLCAEHWCRQVDAALEAKTIAAPGHYIQLRYEDMLAEPVASLRRIIESCGLPWAETLERRIDSHDIEAGRAWQWQNELPPEVQERIIAAAGHRLEKLGYK